jgi:hypothetical protein
MFDLVEGVICWYNRGIAYAWILWSRTATRRSAWPSELRR